MNVSEPFRIAADVTSIGTLVAAIVELLPAVAALVTIVWTGIRIYETRTVQSWLARRRKRLSKSPTS